MPTERLHRKMANKPEKVLPKKAKPRKGSIEAILNAVKIARKENLDLTFLKP